MSGRDPESILLEAEHARLLLADLLELNKAISRMAEAITTIPVELLTLLIPTPGAAEQTSESVLEHVRSAIGEVHASQSLLIGMIELLDGRGKRLNVELEEAAS